MESFVSSSDLTSEQMVVAHSFNPKLDPGDVALILRKDGGPEIHHNLPHLATTGELVGGPGGEAAGIILALALTHILTHDEQALTAAMRTVAMLLEDGKVSLLQ
jgi:hypothetical protein